MIDFTWKVFSQTGNIETYLILKELEADHHKMLDSDSGNKQEIDSNI